MILKLNRNENIPLYVQVKNRIEELIKSCVLKPNTKLPSTRELASSLRVSRNTVLQAYELLEAEGLVYSGVGKGTFVHEFINGQSNSFFSDKGQVKMSFEGLLSSSWTRSYATIFSSFERILESDKRNDFISFASDSIDENMFPPEDFKDCLISAFRRYGTYLLAADTSQGFLPLLEFLAGFMGRRGIIVKPENILITSGIQQGLSIIGRLFLDPGDRILLENFTYPGALGVLRSLQANCIGIPMDSEGIRLDILENVLKRSRVKFLYTIPTFHNPTGCVIPPEKRRQLVELCSTYQIIIIEDGYAQELGFDRHELLPLKALDESDGIVYMGSFSETLFPGIRISWIAAAREIIEKLTILKSSADLYTNLILQAAVLEFLQKGYFDKQLKKKKNLLSKRSSVVSNALGRYFPDIAHWSKPQGGLFQWIELPGRIDALDLLLESRQKGVIFTPDRLFSVEEWQKSGFRIGFGNVDEEKIWRGIGTIGEILKTMI